MTMVQSGRFLVGTVISQTFTAFFTRIIPFGSMALIGFIPTLIFFAGYFYSILQFPVFAGFPEPGEAGEPIDPDAFADLPWVWISIGLAVFYVASIATTAVWLAATSYGTFQYLRGQPVRLWQSLQRGVAVLMPCLGAMFVIAAGAAILSVIAFVPIFAFIEDLETPEAIVGMIGWFFLAITILFVVVAIFAIRLWVTVPAIAVERPGVFAALRRSWNLTRGHFWQVFGVILVMWAGTAGVSVVAGIVVLISVGFGGIAGVFIGQGLNLLLSLIANALFAIAAAVAYVELRRAKEGFGIEDIAAVFD